MATLKVKAIVLGDIADWQRAQAEDLFSSHSSITLTASDIIPSFDSFVTAPNLFSAKLVKFSTLRTNDDNPQLSTTPTATRAYVSTVVFPLGG